MQNDTNKNLVELSIMVCLNKLFHSAEKRNEIYLKLKDEAIAKFYEFEEKQLDFNISDIVEEIIYKLIVKDC